MQEERDRTFEFLKQCERIVSFPGRGWKFEERILRESKAQLLCLEAIPDTYTRSTEKAKELNKQFPNRLLYLNDNFLNPRHYRGHVIDGFWIDFFSFLVGEYTLTALQTVKEWAATEFRLVITGKNVISGRSQKSKENTNTLLNKLNIQRTSDPEADLLRIIVEMCTAEDLYPTKGHSCVFPLRPKPSPRPTYMQSCYLEVTKEL